MAKKKTDTTKHDIDPNVEGLRGELTEMTENRDALQAQVDELQALQARLEALQAEHEAQQSELERLQTMEQEYQNNRAHMMDVDAGRKAELLKILAETAKELRYLGVSEEDIVKEVSKHD